MSKIIEIKNEFYCIDKLNAIQQTLILKRMSPLIKGFFDAVGVINHLTVVDLLNSADILIDVLSSLSEVDIMRTYEDILSSVYRGKTKRDPLYSNGKSMLEVYNIDVVTLNTLIYEAFRYNFETPFMELFQKMKSVTPEEE